MKLLLDTHIWLWSLLDPNRLSDKVGKELEQPTNELWLSPISLWETILLHEKGKLRLEPDAFAWIKSALQHMPFKEAPINNEVALQSSKVELAHQDPADRFIAATAQIYELTLVTADERLFNSDAYSLLANR